MDRTGFEQFLKKAEELRMLSVIVSKDGEVIAEHHFDGQYRRNIYSASKSFTSAAVGIAIREGLVDLNEKLTDAFPDDLPAEVNENLAKATVRDLLTMCLGQPRGFLMGDERPLLNESDWVKYSLALPFTDAPDTKFVYNNVGPYLAGVLVQRRAGCDLVSYLMPRLFAPLGIRRPMWEEDPDRMTFGAGGLFLSGFEFHRFGLLYLNEGQWNGKQLIPKDWVYESTRKQVENGTPYGYGYLFWGSPFGIFRADGKDGQLSYIMREKNAVVTMVSECRRTAELQQLVFDELYPLI
ncbi:MAG: serine hydrolase [Lachnospiraceae bacterium]|nr:serine hydrolase [Lachnospiraceae bacterium]